MKIIHKGFPPKSSRSFWRNAKNLEPHRAERGNPFRVKEAFK